MNTRKNLRCSPGREALPSFGLPRAEDAGCRQAPVREAEDTNGPIQQMLQKFGPRPKGMRRQMEKQPKVTISLPPGRTGLKRVIKGLTLFPPTLPKCIYLDFPGSGSRGCTGWRRWQGSPSPAPPSAASSGWPRSPARPPWRLRCPRTAS